MNIHICQAYSSAVQEANSAPLTIPSLAFLAVSGRTSTVFITIATGDIIVTEDVIYCF